MEFASSCSNLRRFMATSNVLVISGAAVYELEVSGISRTKERIDTLAVD